jgi:hypothetical protein
VVLAVYQQLVGWVIAMACLVIRIDKQAKTKRIERPLARGRQLLREGNETSSLATNK